MKTVLITGASRGIGEACARLFCENGYRVIGTYNSSKDRADAITSELVRKGYDISFYRLDVSVSAQVNELRDILETNGIYVDILVNNAGIAQQKLFTDITDEDWDRMLATDLSSMFYTSRAFLPHMIDQKYGRVINISSVWGTEGGSCEVHYSAAKAGVIGLTRALAKEEGLSGITVNCVAPGATDTDMLKSFTGEELADIASENALNRIVTTRAVASAIVYLASDDAGYITGEIVNINAGR